MHKATKTLNIRSLFDLVRASVRRLRSWHIYVSLLVPLLFLTYDLLSGRLGVDPMRAIEKSLGVTAIYILITIRQLYRSGFHRYSTCLAFSF